MAIESRRHPTESREAGRAPIDVSIESKASSGHPDRNEDAALGDANRLAGEKETPPVLHTSDAAADLEAIRQAAEQEEKTADDLKSKGIYGTLDGVSGRGSNGSGLVASRLASGKIAEIMSHMPADANAERARRSIDAAMKAAHQKVAEYKKDRPDLQEMATTADVIKLIDNGDGTFDAAYGHCGDSRIYVMDGESGQIRCETVDDGYAGQVLRDGKINREQYDQVMNAPDMDSLPKELKVFYKYRNVVTDVIGMENEGKEPRITTGVIKVKKGDKILISSDGIHDNLTQQQIADILRAGGSMADVAAAAAKVADSGEGRAKPDDITGSLIEIGAAAPEKKGGKPGSERGEPTAEQLGQWQKEVEGAGAEIARLEGLKKTAGSLEPGRRIQPGQVTAKDMEMIRQLGGIEGIDQRLRDWKAYSLGREYQLAKHDMEEKRQEVGMSLEQIKAEVEKQKKIVDWQKQVANVARSKGPGNPVLAGASMQALASVEERMRLSQESAADILKQAETTAAESRRKIAALEAVIGSEVQLSKIADEWRQVEEQRRADHLKAEEQRQQASRQEVHRAFEQKTAADQPIVEQRRAATEPKQGPAAGKPDPLARLKGWFSKKRP